MSRVLDAITDVVLAYHPKKKVKPWKRKRRTAATRKRQGRTNGQ